MLTIKNIKWTYLPFTYTRQLVNVLNNHFKNAKIKTAITYDETANVITFNPVERNKIAISSVDNRIELRPTDPRVRALGRSHLLSKRLTYNQYLLFFYTIQKELDLLGLNADIMLEYKNKVHVLRLGKDKFTDYPVPKSFPISM